MCSGTEAPLLALEMISKACKQQTGVELPIEHVFSCEIEPYKQAYIQRNMAPPLLFRDVRELGSGRAHTAFGALADVPCTAGSVDMLVAGTSCVDYSTLNNQKKVFTVYLRLVSMTVPRLLRTTATIWHGQRAMAWDGQRAVAWDGQRAVAWGGQWAVWC